MDGEFISDDGHYVANNFYIRDLSADNLVAIVSPTSAVPLVVENYAPVHVLLHAAEWQLFGSEVRGYHLVNVALHALAAWLLAVLFARSGVAPRWAMLGSAFFLVHPANVEAVAWISQLKTTAAMVLALGALLLRPRRPAWGSLLFALALLAKPTAAVALFFAIALEWTRASRPQDGADRREHRGVEWAWLGVWGGVFVLFSIAELAAFGQTAARHPEIYPDPFVRTLSTVAIGLRYLVMAGTSVGTSTFHEPAPTTSLFDPWLLGAVAALGLIGWRIVVVLRARRIESAFWIWALVSWLPISGLIPLPFPIADRYLYFILPGLIGALLLAGPEAYTRIMRTASERWRTRVRRGLVLASIVWIAAFAFVAHQRAYVWQTAESMSADSERHYPQGSSAMINQAHRASERGDAAQAVALLRQAHARGYTRLLDLLPPNHARIQNAPEFIELKREWAGEWVVIHGATEKPHQPELMMLTQAYITLGDLDAARRTMHRAIYAGGPMTDYLRGALDQLDALEQSGAGRP